MAEVIVNIAQPKRGPGRQEAVRLAVSTCSFTWSWGVQPGEGAMTFVAPQGIQVIQGAWVEIGFPGMTFYGVVQNGPFVDGTGAVVPTLRASQGQNVTLRFVDTRLYLRWDSVMCAFNQRWTEVVNGVRRKRYWHIFPNDARAYRKTWTDTPLSAELILRSIFGSQWMQTRWLNVFHPDMATLPIYDLDCLSGRKVADVLAEVGERLGMVVTLLGGPFELVWARKGEGAIPVYPDNADNKELSYRITNAPTRVGIVGERNRYLLLNVNLEPDWNRNWEQFWPNEDRLAHDLFANDGQYNALAGDVEQIQGRQLAGAKAREMTVREYCALRKLRDGVDFADYKKFQGRARMDMPAALYLRLIVFRAFATPARFPVGTLGEVDLRSWQLVDDIPAGVNYDPIDGSMTAVFSGVDPNTFAHAGGNGFAVVKGYAVGVEIFRTVRPERFNLDQFTRGQKLWKAITLQVDDRGDGYRYVLLDEAVIDTSDMVKIVDGYGVLNAAPSLAVPQIMACLCFEADRFFYQTGKPLGVEEMVQVPGLREEVVFTGQTQVQIPYSDGKTAELKAFEIAAVLLRQYYANPEGGFTQKLRDTDVILPLNGAIDRISVEYGPGGRTMRVDLATERSPRNKVLERDFDRSVQMQQLLPGTRELRQEANLMRSTAEAFRTDPALQRELVNALHGRLGGRPDLQPVIIDTPLGGGLKLDVGTPLWKPPTVMTDNAQPGTGGSAQSLDPNATTDVQATQTRALLPANTDEETSHFLGVTVRHQERAEEPLRVQASGEALARVMGPVSAGDSVCRSNGNAYLAPADKDSTGVVGQALQDIAGAEVKLIAVMLGFGGGGGGGGEVNAVYA